MTVQQVFCILLKEHMCVRKEFKYPVKTLQKKL